MLFPGRLIIFLLFVVGLGLLGQKIYCDDNVGSPSQALAACIQGWQNGAEHSRLDHHLSLSLAHVIAEIRPFGAILHSGITA
jgi:hypothetical protein